MKDSEFIRSIISAVEENQLPQDSKLYDKPYDRLMKIADQLAVLEKRGYHNEVDSDMDKYLDAYYRYLRCISLIMYKNKGYDNFSWWLDEFAHEVFTAINSLQHFSITGKHITQIETLDNTVNKLIEKYDLNKDKI